MQINNFKFYRDSIIHFEIIYENGNNQVVKPAANTAPSSTTKHNFKKQRNPSNFFHWNLTEEEREILKSKVKKMKMKSNTGQKREREILSDSSPDNSVSN